jgi:hypothetical protein
MKNATTSASVEAVTCSTNTNGMLLQSASPSMVCGPSTFNSIVYNDSLGLVMAGSSSPGLLYNKVKHNDKRGIHVGGTSNPDLDPLDPGEGDGGRNSICYYDDDDPSITTMPGWYYDLYNNTQDTIDAEGNYWGDPTNYWDGDDPYVHTSQNVDYIPMLDSDPLSGYGGSWRIGVMGASLPLAYHLGQNYPNPFNAVTKIPYSVAAAGHVSIRVYNLRGQLVRSLVDSHVQGGEHLLSWDSKDERGQRVSSGIYFYRLEAQHFARTKKLILLK